MTTKFDVGQTVMVKSKITEINLRDYGDKEKYKVQVGDGWGVWVSLEDITEVNNEFKSENATRPEV